MRNLRRSLLAVALTSGVGTSVLHAQLNLSTGLGPGAVPLAEGAMDPYWKISTNGGLSFSNAFVLKNSDNAACGCGIIPNLPTGQWISDVSGISTGWGSGGTVYVRRTFDLSGFDLSTVNLSARFATMDNVHGIYLNGNLIPGTTLIWPSTYPWQYETAFSVASTSGWFNSGINTLEFRASSVNSVWDGVLLRQGTVTGDALAVVPEPGTVLLVATGLTVLGFVRRRNR
jgi:hypothetical protein